MGGNRVDDSLVSYDVFAVVFLLFLGGGYSIISIMPCLGPALV